MNTTKKIQLSIPYPTRDGDLYHYTIGNHMVDIACRITLMESYYAKKRNKWDVDIVEVPPGYYPTTGKQRAKLGKIIYEEIVNAGYAIPHATTAIANKIIERYDGDV